MGVSGGRHREKCPLADTLYRIRTVARRPVTSALVRWQKLPPHLTATSALENVNFTGDHPATESFDPETAIGPAPAEILIGRFRLRADIPVNESPSQFRQPRFHGAKPVIQLVPSGHDQPGQSQARCNDRAQGDDEFKHDDSLTPDRNMASPTAVGHGQRFQHRVGEEIRGDR